MFKYMCEGYCGIDKLTRVFWKKASQYRLDGFYDREATQSRNQCVRAVGCNREELAQTYPPDLLERISILWDCMEELRLYDMGGGVRLRLSSGHVPEVENGAREAARPCVFYTSICSITKASMISPSLISLYFSIPMPHS